MFIEKRHRPTIELAPTTGEQAPTLVHYLSNRVDPLKAVLPLLSEAANLDEEQVLVIVSPLSEAANLDEEQVLVIVSPLSEVIDETIRLHRHPDFVDQVVVDRKQQQFFEAVKHSLANAIAKIELIHFVAMEDEENDSA